MKMIDRKVCRKGVITILFVCIILSFAFVFALIKMVNGGGMYEMNAVHVSASSAPSIAVERLDIKAVVRKDRKVELTENFTIRFLKDQTMFYRMLDKRGARYYDIQASCPENPDFYYYVADNPDYSDFLDINCVGRAEKGNVWTYCLTYVMEENIRGAWDKFSIDVIGYGGPVEINNVTVELQFPDKAQALELWIGKERIELGTASVTCAENLQTAFSEDEKTLYMSADVLKKIYNAEYNEYMAAGFTVHTTFADGVLVGKTTSLYFTKNLPWIILGGVAIFVATFFICLKTRKKREVISVVNVTAPDEMDPMKMGKWLDGIVDNEDVTSMIYYFAEKGYLEIDLMDEDDPILRKKKDLPAAMPIYVATLVNGLFKQGEQVAVSELSEKYYAYVEIAKKQMPTPTMYEMKSILGFVSGGILGIIYTFLTTFLMAKKQIGGGYNYYGGLIVAFPVLFILLFSYIFENYRYKWKKTTQNAARIGLGLIATVAIILFAFFLAPHIMTSFEILVVSGFSFLATLLGTSALSRKEEYVKELGDILGFKDFIIYTEEDKIKFMLEENPQLYYKVLPYAQVLGVTNEWEEKFANILIPAPTWCTSTRMSVFDYMIFNRCMTKAMVTAMRPPQSSTGGRSGSGGGFSGGGGGFGGGGFGSR